MFAPLVSRRLALCGVALLAAPSVFADDVVTLSPSTALVTANAQSQRYPLTSPATLLKSIALNLSTPISPSSGYTGPTFYGGIYTTSPSFDYLRFSNDNTSPGRGNDTFVMYATAGYSYTTADVATGLFLFKQANFSSGLNTGNVQIDSLSFNGRVGGSSVAGNAYFVLQRNGSTYMITPATGYSATWGSTIAVNDLAASSWYNYDPSVNVGTVNTTLANKIAAPLFSNVTAVGLLLRVNHTVASTAAMSANFDEFRATGQRGPTVFTVAPADLTPTFWTGSVQPALASGPVDVVLQNGTYTRTSELALSAIGHATNRLTIRASTTGSAVLTGAIPNVMGLLDCQNVTIKGLTFTGTGPTDNALRIRESQNIQIEQCAFIDLPNIYYAALSVTQPTTDRVVVKDNLFDSVGSGSHAHMIYGSYGVQRLIVVGNEFRDCAGSFVRFRDASDQGVVWGNTFVSSGTYLSKNPVMIEIPVFNDVDPGDEVFGTNFLIASNTFTYSSTTLGDQTQRFAVCFHHSGFNPTGRTHLISAANATTLGSGTVTQRRAIMQSNLGLDGNLLHFWGNTSTNVQYNMVYRCWAAYAGVVAPWEGVASIGTAANATAVVTTEAQAIAYYD